MNWIASNMTIGWPNCWRVLAYSRPSSRHRLPAPHPPPPRPPRPRAGGDNSPFYPPHPLAALADDFLPGHVHVLEEERHSVRAADAHLVVLLAGLETGSLRVDEERRDPAVGAALLVVGRKDDDNVGA